MPERYIKNKRLQISFRKNLEKIIGFYANIGGLSQFYNEYICGEIKEEINNEVLDLLKKIRYSITRYPMKHLGYSLYGKHYPIYEFTQTKSVFKASVTRDSIIENFGSFSIPIEYYKVFTTIGGFIIGNKSIISRWFELTYKFMKKDPASFQVYEIMHNVNTYPVIHEKPKVKIQFHDHSITIHRTKKDIEEIIHNYLWGSSFSDRVNAELELLEIGEDAEEKLISNLYEIEDNDKWRIISILGKLKSKKAIKTFEDIYTNTSNENKIQIIKALDEISHNECINLLQIACEENNILIKLRAQIAIDMIQSVPQI